MLWQLFIVHCFQKNGINSQIYKEKKEANCSNLLNEVGNIMVTSHQNPASNELQVNPEIQVSSPNLCIEDYIMKLVEGIGQ